MLMSNDSQTWYIVKHLAGHCEIVLGTQLEQQAAEIQEQWGPFSSLDEAFARRVGLIRAGKCQPV